MKTYFVVQYNDCYGNGDTNLEVIVESHDDFKEWLKQRNEEREEFGESEEFEYEFNLIPLTLYKP
jgi:hypothetical protein